MVVVNIPWFEGSWPLENKFGMWGLNGGAVGDRNGAGTLVLS